MICFECAKKNEEQPAVAVCQQCGVGLCFEHLIEARHELVGGTHEGCRHEVPRRAVARADLREPAEVA